MFFVKTRFQQQKIETNFKHGHQVIKSTNHFLACANYLRFHSHFQSIQLKRENVIGSPATNMTKLTVASAFCLPVNSSQSVNMWK